MESISIEEEAFELEASTGPATRPLQFHSVHSKYIALEDGGAFGENVELIPETISLNILIL